VPPNIDERAARRFFAFIAERHRAYYTRHALSEQPPWCEDPIVNRFFFTNVYRELDPGTVFIVERLPTAHSPREAIFWALAYRLAFNERSMALLLDNELLDPKRMKKNSPHVRKLLRATKNPFTPAYIVSNYGRTGTKVDVITDILVGVAEAVCETWPEGMCNGARSRNDYVTWCLLHAYGIGKFVAFQSLVDLCYPGTKEPASGASWLPWDNDGWVVAGPGAERGLHLLFPDEQVTPRTSNALVFALCEVQGHYLKSLKMPGWTKGTRQVHINRSNMQNCCCEFSKYERIRTGGRARRKFNQKASHERDLESLGHGQQLEMT
jgi:hypothetical protein